MHCKFGKIRDGETVNIGSVLLLRCTTLYMEIVRKLPQLLLLAVMSIAAAEVNRNYSSQLKDAVVSLNALLDYMLVPQSVVGDTIFGVVLARGEFCSCVLTLR